MQNQTHSPVTQSTASSTYTTAQQLEAKPTGKAIYTKPVLTLYGAVSELTMSITGSNTDTNGGSLNVPSDRRVKENITHIGHHPSGIGLYLFDYKPEFRAQWGHVRQFGVMADEVETVMPAAVTTHTDGYKRVNYHLLGITHSRTCL